ncbi:MAG: hypothetical protein ACPG5T_04865, partial [Endozoicomonas sp.]
MLLLTAITIGSAVAGFQEAFQSSHPDLNELIKTCQGTLKPFTVQCNLTRPPGQCITDRTLLALYSQYPRHFCRLVADQLSRTKDPVNSDLFRLVSKHMKLGKVMEETLLSQIQLIQNQPAYRDTLYHWLISNTTVLKAFQSLPEFRNRIIYTLSEDILDKNPVTITPQMGGNRLSRSYKHAILNRLSRHLGIEIGLIETDKKKNTSYKLFSARPQEALEPLQPGTQFWSTRLMNPEDPGDRKLVFLETPEGAAFLLNAAHETSPGNEDDRNKERKQKELNDDEDDNFEEGIAGKPLVERTQADGNEIQKGSSDDEEDNFEEGIAGNPLVDPTASHHTRSHDKTKNTSRERGEQRTASSPHSPGATENIRKSTDKAPDKAPHSYWDLAKMWLYLCTSSKAQEIATASLVDGYYYLKDGKIPNRPPGDQPRIPKKEPPLLMDAPYPEHRNWQQENVDDPG